MVGEDLLEPSDPAQALAGLTVGDGVKAWTKEEPDALEHLGGVAKGNAADQVDHHLRH
jgi:hypothetical protein